MMATSDHYQACADQSLRDAQASILANVRERHLHSAKAWQAMADRAAGIERSRRERQELAQSAATPDQG